jgi:Leucine-rich repeat (LRR) protein
MHDLVWTIARYLGKDENHTLKEDGILKRESSSKLRRLSMKGIEANSEVVTKEKCLRTLLIGKKVLGNAVVDLCRNLSNLRILDLSFCNISTLLDSLSRLVHLRYLDVSNSIIRILPVTMGNLKNLIYLDIMNCIELSHLPHSITMKGEISC